MKMRIIKKYLDKMLKLLILLFSFLFVLKCFSIVFTGVFSFDGAIIAQVAKNFAEKLQYKTDYWNEKFNISAIGATVIMPVALFFKIFGRTFESGLLVNAIYMVLLFCTVIYYLKYCLKLNDFFICLWAVIFYSTNKLFEYGFGLYGEIPMIFYFIAGLVFLHKYFEAKQRKYIFAAGLFLGLGFLTKFVFLIILPGLLLALAFDFFMKSTGKTRKLTGDYPVFLFAFILPNFLFELYKLFSIGIKKFIFHWTWFLHAAGVQSGAVKPDFDRIKDTPDLFSKFTKHLDLLSGYAAINKYIVIFLLLLGIFLFYFIISYMLKNSDRKKEKQELKEVLNPGVLFLITVMLSYFVWWIFITPTDRAWHRRIMPGIILYEICFVVLLFVVYRLFEKNSIKGKKVFKLLPALAGLLFFAGAGYGLLKTENIKISFKETKEKTEIMQAARYMTTFPAGSVFFGFKWWQAPVISFASGKVFRDFFLSDEMKITGEKKDKYLVLDRPAMENQELCIKEILSDFEYELVYVYDEVRIYKLINRLRHREYVEECN